MSFSKVCITVLLSTAAISMQAAAQDTHTNRDSQAATAANSAPAKGVDLLAQADSPVAFSCYVYPSGSPIASSSGNGLVCPALEPGDGIAKPGWTKEYRCYASGNTATCNPIENPVAGTLADLSAPASILRPAKLESVL
jgi:hypothetical protein